MVSLSVNIINQNIDNKYDFIKQCENQFNQQIKTIALSLKNNRENKPIIFLSGPSGSGKTTTASMLADCLNNFGIETIVISMDNYFFSLNNEQRNLFSENLLDLETPQRIDIELLNKHLLDLANCKPVNLPVYDFITNTRNIGKNIVTRSRNGVVIVEGIHALNPDVTGKCNQYSSCIYVSTRTRIVNNEATLHPARIRLMRRMIRDKLYRGRSISKTIELFTKVQSGEEKYIAPYKYRSSHNIDTFFPYEISVYKDILLPQLLKNNETALNIQDIIEILKDIKSIKPNIIPQNALIREFIGKS